MEECIFSSYYEADCKRDEQLSQNRFKNRIKFIIKARKIREDTLHKKLVPLLQNDCKLKVKYHLSCADKYFSTKVILKDKPVQNKDFNPMKWNLMQRHNVCTVTQNAKWNVIQNTPADGDLCFVLQKLVVTVKFAKKNKIYEIPGRKMLSMFW